MNIKRRSFLKGLAAVAALPSLAWARLEPLEIPKALTPTLTEAQLTDLLRACWEKGADSDIILCAPWQKQVISGFAGDLVRSANGPGPLGSAVHVYASDFGEARVLTELPEDLPTGIYETLDIRKVGTDG